ncbi:hypothetical protein [Peijinzhouia sedimentorum]
MELILKSITHTLLYQHLHSPQFQSWDNGKAQINLPQNRLIAQIV